MLKFVAVAVSSSSQFVDKRFNSIVRPLTCFLCVSQMTRRYVAALCLYFKIGHIRPRTHAQIRQQKHACILCAEDKWVKNAQK